MPAKALTRWADERLRPDSGKGLNGMRLILHLMFYIFVLRMIVQYKQFFEEQEFYYLLYVFYPMLVQHLYQSNLDLYMTYEDDHREYHVN